MAVFPQKSSVSNKNNPLSRPATEMALFFVFGLAQFALDTFLMLVYHSLGAPVGVANTLSRACAGAAGYWLNGRFNFARSRAQLTPRSFSRFWILWLTLTIVSTVSMMGLARWLGGGSLTLLVLKICVEGFLFIASFLASRIWVYRT